MWEEEFSYRMEQYLNKWIRAIYKDNGQGWEEVENNEDYPFNSEEDLLQDLEKFKNEKRKENDVGWRYIAIYLNQNRMIYNGCNYAEKNQFLHIAPNSDSFMYTVSEYLKKYHDKDIYGDEEGENYLRYKYSGKHEFV